MAGTRSLMKWAATASSVPTSPRSGRNKQKEHAESTRGQCPRVLLSMTTVSNLEPEAPGEAGSRRMAYAVSMSSETTAPFTTFSDWLDRHAGRLFVLPACLLVLAFSIFPLIISAWMAVSRFSLTAQGPQLKFIGWLNFRKLFFGSEQYHLLGTFAPKPVLGWLIIAAVLALIGRGIYA